MALESFTHSTSVFVPATLAIVMENHVDRPPTQASLPLNVLAVLGHRGPFPAQVVSDSDRVRDRYRLHASHRSRHSFDAICRTVRQVLSSSRGVGTWWSSS